MKNYNDFNKIYIGASDIAELVVRSANQLGTINFGEDGRYTAYECFDTVEIGAHYHLVYSGECWCRIYDDYELIYSKCYPNYNNFNIYRAGEFGCIIHWHN